MGVCVLCGITHVGHHKRSLVHFRAAAAAVQSKLMCLPSGRHHHHPHARAPNKTITFNTHLFHFIATAPPPSPLHASSLARVLTRTLTRHSHAHTEHMFNSTRAHTHETNVRRPTSRSSPSLSTNLHACVTQPLMRAHAHLPLAATRLSHPRPAVAWLLPIPTLTHTCGSAYERVRTHAHTRDTLS